jgi:hypothetical protein
LSPIELPTDIVRRPALRRILLSTQIDSLAKTSMEFIEGEKNFNKILCRLSAIMHQDDPRYLDLTFDRTPEQRQKYKQEAEAAKAAATTLSAGTAQDNVVEDLDPKQLDAQVEAKIEAQHKLEEQVEKQEESLPDEDVDMDVDTEAQEVVKRVKELLLVKKKKNGCKTISLIDITIQPRKTSITAMNIYRVFKAHATSYVKLACKKRLYGKN